jgi:hypothetical protein
MGFEFDTEDIPDDPTQGFNVKPGSYHVEVHKVDEEGGTKGEMVVYYEVLAGTVPNQEGEIHRDYYSKTAKAQGRMITFAIACGLITLEEWQAAKKTKEPMTIEFENAVGLQLCVDLFEDEYQGKTKTKCGFGLYRLDDKKVADKGIPLNMEMVKKVEARGVKLKMPTKDGTGGHTASDKSESDPFGPAI